MEQDAQFCAMCGRQAPEDTAHVLGHHATHNVRLWLTPRLNKWVIVAPLAVLVFGGTLLWTIDSEKVGERISAIDPEALTRSTAAALIEQSKDMRSFTGALLLDRSAVSDGELQGLWTFRNLRGWELYLSQIDSKMNAALRFTSKGLSEALAKITEEKTRDGTKVLGLFDDKDAGQLWALNVHIEGAAIVTVTGITDAPQHQTGKLVHFDGRFLLPGVLRKYMWPREEIGSGTAHLVLYDDGWRVESVEVDWKSWKR